MNNNRWLFVLPLWDTARNYLHCALSAVQSLPGHGERFAAGYRLCSWRTQQSLPLKASGKAHVGGRRLFALLNTRSDQSRWAAPPAGHWQACFQKTSASNNRRKPVETSNNSNQLVGTSNNSKQPVETFNNSKQLVESSHNSRQPVETFNNIKQPVETFNNSKQQVETSNNCKQPVETSNNIKQPVETFNNSKQLVETSNNNKQPVEKCNNSNQPVEKSNKSNQPVEKSKNSKQPVETSTFDLFSVVFHLFTCWPSLLRSMQTNLTHVECCSVIHHFCDDNLLFCATPFTFSALVSCVLFRSMTIFEPLFVFSLIQSVFLFPRHRFRCGSTLWTFLVIICPTTVLESWLNSKKMQKIFLLQKDNWTFWVWKFCVKVRRQEVASKTSSGPVNFFDNLDDFLSRFLV